VFKLRRFYVDTIGVPSNRFVDVCVDVTGLTGEPCDTIVWLRNGAGKTTMLSLLLALVLPDRRDFLASRTKKRTLEDLVGAQDTAHVIAEWIDPHGRILITGAIYQWDGRVKPRDHNGEGKSRLKRYWWCLHPDDGLDGATFDTLPTTSRTLGSIDLDAFAAHVTGLSARGANATGAERINEWHEALRQRRFDPDLFRYFADVNATEGGIDALFSGIDSPAAFARYLLRFVADERRVTPVRELLGDTAAEIAKRPTYAAERDFCAEAGPLVASLGDAHGKVTDATAHRATARAGAAAFKRALLDAVEHAGRESTLAGLRRETAEARRLDARTRTDLARRQRDEYFRIAAVFRHDTATIAAGDAERLADVTRREADAWAAVPSRSATAVASAELAAHRQAMQAAAKDAAPALAALEYAHARLAGSLDHHLTELAAQLETIDESDDDANTAKTNAEQRRRAAITTQSELNAERDQHARDIDRVETRTRQLVDTGVIASGERLDAAIARIDATVTASTAAMATIRATMDQHQAGRRDIAEHLPSARQIAADKIREHDALSADGKRLHDLAAGLAAEHRLRELAQADVIDPIAEATDLLAALATAVAALDGAALDERVTGADDERAIAGLEAAGILPPRHDVSLVVEALTGAGIGAQSGWRYLSEHHLADAARIIASMPDIVDGVIVYTDPAAAAAAINGLDVTEAVVIARADAFTETGGERVIVGPTAARYDPTAAAAELGRRSERSATRRQRLEVLARGRARDEDLAARVRHLRDQVPADGVAGLAARTTTALSAVEAADAALRTLTGHDDQLAEKVAALDGELDGERAKHASAKAASAAVASVLDDERDNAAPARARVEAIPALLSASKESEGQAEAGILAADTVLDGNRRHRVNAELRQREWSTQRALLPVAVSNDDPLEAVQAAVTVAQIAVREQYPEVELRRNVDDAEARLAGANRAYESIAVDVRRRTEELFTTDPAAHDVDLRAAAAGSARDTAERAQQALGAAQSELAEAGSEVVANTPGDRSRHVADPPVTPADRVEALQLAASAIEEAATLQVEVGRWERERDDAGNDLRTWTSRAAMLRDQADKLPSIDPAAAGAGHVDPDDDQVRLAVAAVARRVEVAESAYASAMTARLQRADALRTWAGQDRFGKVADDEHGMAVRQLRDLFRSDGLTDRVADRADDLAADLRTRQHAIDQQIAQVETHKNNVVIRLGDLVTEALTDLNRASTLSELPADIGPWAGQPFLTIAPRTRPSAEQITVRVGELVDRMVAGGKVDLDPVELLWRATDAAVIDGFRASILKPAPDQPSGRTPVEDMHKWSGGENLTASLVLFCVLAKLRAENRTGSKAGAAGGVVPLDNPLGKANYLPFLELQRKVAAANGVQLLFWTGIGDLAAVGAFPRIAAMRKKPAVGRPGVAYVVTDRDGSATIDTLTSQYAVSIERVEHLGAVRSEQ
jgi:hypothetical protein